MQNHAVKEHNRFNIICFYYILNIIFILYFFSYYSSYFAQNSQQKYLILLIIFLFDNSLCQYLAAQLQLRFSKRIVYGFIHITTAMKLISHLIVIY